MIERPRRLGRGSHLDVKEHSSFRQSSCVHKLIDRPSQDGEHSHQDDIEGLAA
jgi:hypothetical protein